MVMKGMLSLNLTFVFGILACVFIMANKFRDGNTPGIIRIFQKLVRYFDMEVVQKMSSGLYDVRYKIV